MALKYLVDLNLGGNEIQNASLQTVAGEPTGLATGHIIYDTVANQVKIYDGEWKVVGLVADETTLTVSSGQISIKDGGVGAVQLAAGSVITSKINDSAVTTGKIANLNVTEGKIGASAVTESKIASSAVTTAKIANNAVTFAKLEDVAEDRIVGRISTGAGDAEELTAAQVRTIINVADGANNYSLPVATTSVLGGVKDGDGVSISGTGVLDVDSTVVRTSGNQSIAGNKTFTGTTVMGDATVNGDFTINGTLTTVNTTELEVTDKRLTLNNGNTDPALADGAGIEIEIDPSTNAGIIWNDTAQKFHFLKTDGTSLDAFALDRDIPTEDDIEDIVGGLIVGGTNVTATYNDSAGTLTIASTNTQRSDEEIRDLVADVLVTNATHSGISASDQDASNAVNLVNQYILQHVDATGFGGGGFQIDLASINVVPALNRPVQIQVFEVVGTVKNVVITDVSVDEASGIATVQLPAGDFSISVHGWRA